jgi:hypothetical protein
MVMVMVLYVAAGLRHPPLAVLAMFAVADVAIDFEFEGATGVVVPRRY